MGDIIIKIPVRSTKKTKPGLLRLYFDTGSPRTFLKETIASKMKVLQNFVEPIYFHGLGNGAFFAIGSANVWIRMKGVWVPHLCFVVPDAILDPNYDILIGHDFMQIYDIRVIPRKRRISIDKNALLMALKVR